MPADVVDQTPQIILGRLARLYVAAEGFDSVANARHLIGDLNAARQKTRVIDDRA